MLSFSALVLVLNLFRTLLELFAKQMDRMKSELAKQYQKWEAVFYLELH